MKTSVSTIGQHLTVALIGGLMSAAFALPASNSTGGSGGDLPPPKPPVKRTTPLPPPPPATQGAAASANVLPPGNYTLLVYVQNQTFEASMPLVRNGNGVVLQPVGSRDELRGEIDARGEISLVFVEPNGHRMTLSGPVRDGSVAGQVSYTDGVALAKASFELYPDNPSAARKAKIPCDAGCQAMVLRSTTAALNRFMKGLRLR